MESCSSLSLVARSHPVTKERIELLIDKNGNEYIIREGQIVPLKLNEYPLQTKCSSKSGRNSNTAPTAMKSVP